MACGFWRTGGRLCRKGGACSRPSAAIIGDRQSLAGFTALGVDGYAAESEAEAKAALEKAQRAGCALILVTEAAARHARVHIEAMRQKEGPPVLILPGETGNTGQAEREIEAAIRQAAGAGLWGEEG